jgi:glyoxylase-like metal-dependent hydrolase (beta-lactamase superfamily II)
MFVKTFPVGSFQCNCTILGDPDTKEAIVIDPGDEAEKIISILNQQQFIVKHIIHTHAHIDHIGATCKIKDKTNGEIGLHKEDLFLYDNMKMQAEFLGLSIDQKVSPIDHYLEDNDEIEWGKNQVIKVIHTPGHTPGSLSFLNQNKTNQQNILFTGDTLFMGSIGRTDLWGGDHKLILESIKTKILKLDDDIPVVCGHGPNTSIGQEKMINPFLG